ncbi:MAG TPA: NAD(P)-dependent oxidoreductase [Solirubrobacteraceae bacterium]|nr:NAD(P)-dependent oxidoreductase [Solirubrobacteraceae bacterium]
MSGSPTAEPPAQLGFIGLGAMGEPMAGRLLAAGFDVCGTNRNQARGERLRAQGLRWCSTPREVAESADIVITMLSDDQALRSVALADGGLLAGLRAGATYIDMSTVSPQCSAEVAEAVAGRGASFLEAPVSGSVPQAQSGSLTIMVAGDRGAFERSKAVLGAMGSNVAYLGERGRALMMKLAINLSVAAQMIAFSEGLLLACAHGIPQKQAVDLLCNSAIASPMLRSRGPLTIERQPQPWFALRLMHKDLALALAQAREHDLSMPLSALAHELFSAARAHGHSDEDMVAIYDLLAELAGGAPGTGSSV